jgi:hypothetical protein
LFIDVIPEEAMFNFFAWSLESEHGDLHLGITSAASKPPLSVFGIAFRSTLEGDKAHDWIQKLVEYADGNIVQARLALDRIHNSASPDAVDLNPRRLPRNVQAQYNTAIRNIMQKSLRHNHTPALQAMAAIGRDGDIFQGLELPHLADLLRDQSHQVSSESPLAQSPENILNMADGYLRLLQPLFAGQDCSLGTYHRSFWVFANDEYNEELIMAYAQLRTHKISRSYSFQSGVPSSLHALQMPPARSGRRSLDQSRRHTISSSTALPAEL